jgi:hypothetical protein
LTDVARGLQKRLQTAVDKRFFARYSDPIEMRKCSYVFEQQLRLHPTYKKPESSVNRIIRLCSRQRGDSIAIAQQNVNIVNENITSQLRELMLRIATATEEPPTVQAPLYHSAFSDELAENFAPRATTPAPPTNRLRDRVDEELRRWSEDTHALQRDANGKESVLSFWSRMERACEYRILPKAARVVFANPPSSAMIERDFRVSGMLVTTQRASLAGHTIAMATFLNRNRSFVDPEQCQEIPKDELKNHLPASKLIPIEIVDDLDIDDISDASDTDAMIGEFFSSTTISD